MGLIPATYAYLAVDFFLILSGFVLSHAYFSRPRRGLAAFAQDRFARLYPLHLLTTLAYVALALHYGEMLDWPAVFLNLTLLHNIGLGPGELILNYPAWTISVEFWVNVVVFGVLCVLGPPATRRGRAFLWLLVAAGFAMLFYQPGHLDAHVRDYHGVNAGLARGFACFALGVLAYEWYMARRRADPRGPGAFAEWFWFALILAMVFLPCPWARSRADFAAPFLLACAIVVFAHERGRLARWIARLSGIGEISFSIYLLHYPMIYAVRNEGGGGLFTSTAGATAFLASVLAVSWLCYRYVELPLYRRFRYTRAGATGP